jgi:hypothetical protein
MPINARCGWLYQIFTWWFNPRTNKFEFGPNPCGIWYNSMGDEVRHDVLDEVSCYLLVDKTSDSQCLKDEMTFALLAKVSFHKVAMVDEINNVPKLDVILHGVNIGQ